MFATICWQTVLASVIGLIAVAAPTIASDARQAAQAVSQRGMPADSVQILLALAERLEHPGARATIIRPVGENAPDLILVTEATTPADLERAVRMLVDARHSFGPRVEREMRAHVPVAEVSSESVEGVRVAGEHLARLRSGEELQIPGFGLTRSIVINIADREGAVVETQPALR